MDVEHNDSKSQPSADSPRCPAMVERQLEWIASLKNRTGGYVLEEKITKIWLQQLDCWESELLDTVINEHSSVSPLSKRYLYVLFFEFWVASRFSDWKADSLNSTIFFGLALRNAFYPVMSLDNGEGTGEKHAEGIIRGLSARYPESTIRDDVEREKLEALARFAYEVQFTGEYGTETEVVFELRDRNQLEYTDEELVDLVIEKRESLTKLIQIAQNHRTADPSTLRHFIEQDTPPSLLRGAL